MKHFETCMQNPKLDISFFGWLKVCFYFISLYIGSTITYIGVRHDIVMTLTILMVADYFSGIIKAWKLNIDVTSKRSNKGIIEKITLLAIPFSMGLVFKVVHIPIGITIQTVFTLLIVAELYSFIGNCYCIYTGKDIKEFDAVTYMLRFLKDVLLKFLRNLLDGKK